MYELSNLGVVPLVPPWQAPEGGIGRLLLFPLAYGIPQGYILSPMLVNAWNHWVKLGDVGCSLIQYADVTRQGGGRFSEWFHQGDCGISEPVLGGGNGLNEGE